MSILNVNVNIIKTIHCTPLLTLVESLLVKLVKTRMPVSVDRASFADRRLSQDALSTFPWLARVAVEVLTRFYQRMPGAKKRREERRGEERRGGIL